MSFTGFSGISKDGVHNAITFYEAIKSSNLAESGEATIYALEEYFQAVKKAATLAPDQHSFTFFQGAIAGMLIAFKIQKRFLEQQAGDQGLDPVSGQKPQRPH